MIKMTALNNSQFYINADLIEKMEVTPDTIITLTTGKKFVVKESPDIIIEKIVEFRRRFMTALPEVVVNRYEDL
jgi:flagellar protein FlbD